VFEVYAKAIERVKKLEELQKYQLTVNPVWFSDTFLVYTLDDSGDNFTIIDQFSRWFVYFLIEAGIPVRGALSCGDFYADRSNNLYFGSALIEAYEYGEAQDWIGFLLSPSAVTQLGSLGQQANKLLNYAFWTVPFKTGKKKLCSKLPACILGQWIEINGKNPCLEKLGKLRTRAGTQHIGKYDRTIQFIDECQRMLWKPTCSAEP